MGGFEKLKPAEFDEGNVAAAELNFEDGAVMACAKQHGLLFQRHACFAIGEHALDNKSGLRGIVAHRYQSGFSAEFRSDQRSFVKRSLASAITAFAAFRIGTVER